MPESDHANNRSAAMTPEMLGAMNQMVAAAVKEAVAGVFSALGPTLQSIALTPEKMQMLKEPYVDPAKSAREKRELLLGKQAEAEAQQTRRRHQDNCGHQDVKGQTSIRLIRNFPDRQPRGICVHCHDLITPKEWRIGPPDAQNPRGKAFLAEPHKNYATVIQIASRE